MPKAIKDAGLVDEEVALNDVSDAIIKNVGVY
jgi:chemotaxis response regulator CheB